MQKTYYTFAKNPARARTLGATILARVRPAALQDGRDPATFVGFYPGGTEAVLGYSVPSLACGWRRTAADRPRGHSLLTPPDPIRKCSAKRLDITFTMAFEGERYERTIVRCFAPRVG